MTYLVIAPNANQSPGDFPPQANENFSRLKTIINADHVFNDNTAVNDGAHRQMTMVNRAADPVGPPAAGTNAMVYTKTPTLPYFWNGTAAKEMNSSSFSTVNLTGSFQTIFADPGYEYVGTVTFAADFGTYAGMLIITRVAAPFGNYITKLVASSNQLFQYSGNNLQARGNGNLKCAFQITRVT